MSKNNKYNNYNKTKLNGGKRQEEKLEPVNENTDENPQIEKPIAAPAAEEEVRLEAQVAEIPVTPFLAKSTVAPIETDVAPPVIPPIDDPAPMGTVIVSRRINLRAEASGLADKIDIVLRGTLVDILAVPNSSWFQIKTEDGKEGFIMSHYTEEIS